MKHSRYTEEDALFAGVQLPPGAIHDKVMIMACFVI